MLKNKELAFERLVKHTKFELWLRTTASLMLKDGKTINEIVMEQMDEGNLKIEKKVGEQWVNVNSVNEE